MSEINEIPELQIEGEYIELCKILKLENWVGAGGEAKHVISEGYVYLNGEIETRKRKKVYNGDIVKFQNETIRIITKS